LNETKTVKNWFERRAQAEVKKDTVPYSEHVGSVVAVVLGVLVFFYFVANQMWSTGFFTATFGIIEVSLFYGVMILEIVPNAMKALFGRKNLARFFEVLASVMFVVALAWLFVVFPFNFTYFADVLPGSLRFLLQWISNDIVGGLMVFGLIVAPIIAVYQALVYMFVRRELSKKDLKNA
jgi:hypothetical protein